MRTLLVASSLSVLLAAVPAAQSFVNWETPHVHPLDMTPDRAFLLAVNTADNRLETFDLSCGVPIAAGAIPVGLDPVSVRARTSTEAWVVNQVSDTVSIVDLATGRVRATLDTDDEPADVVFAGTPERAFVSCSQTNTVLVFDPNDLTVAPTTITLLAEDPRAMAVSPAGDEVYVAIFESGNRSTILGGGSTMGPGAFPPNVASDPSGPYGGVNPPPNDGAAFEPAIAGGLPTPPAVGLIVKQDGADQWMDDNGGNWTTLVSGASAAASGRPVGWTLLDHDLAVIDASTLAVDYADHAMNLNMAIGVNPATGDVTIVGTDATNEVRFEPNLKGTFIRVHWASVDPSGPSVTSIVDLNAHLDYSTSTVAQPIRDMALGDPRGIAWNGSGSKAFVTGMGSNNLIVVDAAGTRAGLASTIEVGEGPTGVCFDGPRGAVYVLNKFDGSISVVSTASETEVAQVPFHDPTPADIKTGRKHLYDTHKNSGLGTAACASCHVDARIDRLAWDLGDPEGAMKSVAGQNLAANLPGLAGGFEDFHPMKGPMTTQTFQDIIGKEPLHWRGDRDGLEEFAGAFIGLQGDDTTLTGTEMQEFEDFLASIFFPPNPFRNVDNTLPTNLDMTGHFTSGRFGPAGLPLPNGDAQRGLDLYRPPNLLDAGAVACATCHTLPTGIGTNHTFVSPFAPLSPLPPGPSGELHHALVSQDGSTNVSMKIPQLRNMYDKVGFETTQMENTAGFGFLHDGSVDSLARFLSEPIFSATSDQDIADLVAFMLAFAGSDLPLGSASDFFEAPGPASQDSHAAVGRQTTLVDLGSADPDQLILIGTLLGLADAGDIGLVVKGRQGGLARGYEYVGGGLFQSDRSAETIGAAALQAAAAVGSELTYTAVPLGSETRIGIDRDGDGHFDRDELDLGSDPADAGSVPGICAQPAPLAPMGLNASVVSRTQVDLQWADLATSEDGYTVERASTEPGATFQVVGNLSADATSFTDTGLQCGTTYRYRVQAFNCAGASGVTCVQVRTRPCFYVEQKGRLPRR